MLVRRCVKHDLRPIGLENLLHPPRVGDIGKQGFEGRAGIKAGDRILRINDESTVNMLLDEAVSRLRGPVGDPVIIQVMRDLFDAPRPFSITRELIKLNPPEGQILPCSGEASSDADTVCAALTLPLE